MGKLNKQNDILSKQRDQTKNIVGKYRETTNILTTIKSWYHHKILKVWKNWKQIAKSKSSVMEDVLNYIKRTNKWIINTNIYLVKCVAK